MVKKWSRKGFYISCYYSCTISFLVKILLVKLKYLCIWCAWISIMKKQNSNQNVKFEKMVVFVKASDHYHHECNFLVTFSAFLWNCKRIWNWNLDLNLIMVFLIMAVCTMLCIWVNLVQKLKIVSLSWNLVPLLIQINTIPWWGSPFLFSTENVFFDKFGPKNQNCQFELKIGT